MRLAVVLVLVTAVCLATGAAWRSLERHRRRAERRRRETWSIAVYEGAVPWALSPAAGVCNPVLTARDVSDLSARFVADPFAVHVAGLFHLFFEVMPLEGGRGVIAHATSADLARWAYDAVVLREPFHLSYPYVFSHDDAVYMVPECAESGGVRLYRAVSFPREWSYVATLITDHRRKPPLLEPSLVQHGGRWYLFTYARGSASLHLYSADELMGPWAEHPMSPVMAQNNHFARPAGRVIPFESDLIRFAQDGWPAYGSRVWAFRITTLSASAYAEEPLSEAPVVQAGPERWHRAGMHTVDAWRRPGGAWNAVVDGLDDGDVSAAGRG